MLYWPDTNRTGPTLWSTGASGKKLVETDSVKAFRMMGRTFRAAYEDLFLVVGISLVWWAGALLVVTAAPATRGLQGVANRLANYRRANMDTFWEEARTHVGASWLLTALMLFIFGMIPVNIWFYAADGAGGWRSIVVALWAWALLLYFLVSQYLFPLLCQQNEPSVGLAMRNAALLAMRSPLYSLLGVLFQLVIVAVCFLLVAPVVFLLPGLLALANNFFLTGLLQEMGLAEPPPTLEVKRR